MPCNSEPRSVSFFKKHYDTLNTHQKETDELLNKNQYLEACLCALIREVCTHPIAERLINDASINGKVDIPAFWEKYKSKDNMRLLDSITKNYSKHEITLLKEIIKGIE
tara:strand:+ start:30586 stop:30912 length:327 start_codon:yes stop_codon:yes gene_type:complete